MSGMKRKHQLDDDAAAESVGCPSPSADDCQPAIENISARRSFLTAVSDFQELSVCCEKCGCSLHETTFMLVLALHQCIDATST
mmetsp:Transcript_24114/g.39525  ORF Transcript_24114/g.39525 Transcript_24114/m.39525 type:complete len:84 (+) Transcript_24114:163-414(+)